MCGARFILNANASFYSYLWIAWVYVVPRILLQDRTPSKKQGIKKDSLGLLEHDKPGSRYSEVCIECTQSQIRNPAWVRTFYFLLLAGVRYCTVDTAKRG